MEVKSIDGAKEEKATNNNCFLKLLVRSKTTVLEMNTENNENSRPHTLVERIDIPNKPQNAPKVINYWEFRCCISVPFH